MLTVNPGSENVFQYFLCIFKSFKTLIPKINIIMFFGARIRKENAHKGLIGSMDCKEKIR